MKKKISKSRKKLSQERAIENEKLRVFHQISAFVIHDLKNAAATLSLIVENSIKNIKNKTFLRQSFEAINKEVEKMKRLIDTFSTIPGDIRLKFQKCNINNLIIEILDKFKFHNIEVIQDLGEIPLADCDITHLQTVFHNIIKNSVEAMPEGGKLSISTKLIEKRLKKKSEECVEIVFTDTGHGIPKNFLKNELFKPFKTTKGKGLGIGLYQCKEIINMHRGTIEIKSIRGKGTECTIILPIEQLPKTKLHHSSKLISP